MTGPVERGPLTDEQLDQWLLEAEMFFVNSDPTGRLSSQVTRLVGELRASRAREQALQQRIDRALAECRRHEPSTPLHWAIHLASHTATVIPTAVVRTALTGAEPGTAPLD